MKELSDTLIDKYILGECSQEELKELNAIIQDSDEEANRLFHAEELYHLGKYGRFTDENRIASAEERLFARLDAEKQKKNRVLHIKKMMQYAAVVTLLFVLGGSGAYYAYRQMTPTMMMVMAGDEVKMVTLPDSTKVWLNQYAQLEYPDEFSGTERYVFLKGEAYFEVTKDEHKPFIVKNEVMRVRVLGTKFNLTNDENSPVAKATLVEGQVEVRSNNDDGKVVLCPGQKAELNKATGLLTVKQVDARMDVVWSQNMIAFKKVNIQEIGRALEKYYDVSIIISPELSLDKTYSGTLKKRAAIDSVLQSLQNSIPIKYTISGNQVYLYPEK